MGKTQLKKKKNPFIVILILTGLMLLPFLVFLFDKFLMGISDKALFIGEMIIVGLGFLSAILIYFSFFKN